MVKASGLRGRGGAGFPTGLKWTFLPQEPSRPDLPLRQRRRERAGHVQQPHPDGGGSAPGARRASSSAATRRSATTAYIYLRYEYPLAWQRAAAGDRRVLRRRLSGQEHPRQRVLARHLPAPRRGGVHLRRRDRADRKPGRQAGLAADQAAVSRPSKARSASRRSSTTSRRWPASRTSSTAASTGSSRSACRPIRTTRATPAATGRSCTASAGTSTSRAASKLPLGVTVRELIDEHGGGVWKGRKAKAAIPGGISMGLLTAERVRHARSISTARARSAAWAWAPRRSS